MPIFIVVAVWTKIINKLWTKILITICAVMYMIVIISLWTQQNELEEKTDTLEYVIERDNNYLDCIDKSIDDDDLYYNCIAPFFKILIDTYK